MKLVYLFTKDKKQRPFSKIICKGTNIIHPEMEECSHVAIKMGPIVFESTGKGVNILPYKNWIETKTIVYAFECPKDRKAKDVINNVISKFHGKKYDWLGVLYFTFCVLSFIFFKTPLPKENKWQSDKKFFCVELVESITGEKYSMTSPIQLAKIWIDEGVKQLDISEFNQK